MTWTLADDAAATAEGWSLFECECVLEIERIDCPLDGSDPVFADDIQAVTFVQQHAANGSALHMKALALVS